MITKRSASTLPTAIAVVLVGFAPASAETKDATSPAAPITATGTIKLSVSVTTHPGIPDKAYLTFYSQISVSDSMFTNQASVYDRATVSGGVATYTVTVPYRWFVTSRSDVLNVSVSVYADDADAKLSRSIALPANGVVTNVNLSGSI